MKISDNAAMLEIGVGQGAVYPTLLWDDDNLVLVDAGFSGQLQLICDAIRAEGFDPAGLTGLIFTHGDGDHVGCGRELLQLAPGAQTMAHSLEAPHIDGSAEPVKAAHRRAKLGQGPDAQAQLRQYIDSFAGLTVRIDRRLEGGQVLPICGGVRVIHSPGHTPGHIFLYLESGKTLVTGDGINLVQGGLAPPNPIHTIDMDEAKRSIDALLSLGLEIRQAVAYHGGLFAGDVARGLKALV